MPTADIFARPMAAFASISPAAASAPAVDTPLPASKLEAALQSPEALAEDTAPEAEGSPTGRASERMSPRRPGNRPATAPGPSEGAALGGDLVDALDLVPLKSVL